MKNIAFPSFTKPKVRSKLGRVIPQKM
uniref:Uncharacterized protein n=1 Tax=Rhizophora mucronata TaxID=61149 RepID=A0A2P2NRI2_RHIMU